MIRREFTLLAGVVLILAGCIGPPAKLDLAQASSLKAPVRKAEVGARLSVVIDSVTDARSEKESLGSIAGRSFGNTPIEPWVEQELLQMTSAFFVSVPKNTPPAAASITLRSRILKAYLSGLSTSKTAAVVIECEFKMADGTSATQMFRGQYQSLNWNSNEGEALNAIRQALKQCVEKIKTDLNSRALAIAKASHA